MVVAVVFLFRVPVTPRKKAYFVSNPGFFCSNSLATIGFKSIPAALLVFFAYSFDFCQDCDALWAHCDEGEGVGPNFCLVLPQNMCKMPQNRGVFSPKIITGEVMISPNLF